MNTKHPFEITQSTPPEFPPNVPFVPPESVTPQSVPMPIVYEETSERVEYQVLTRNTLEAKALEADLNALGREGWWLVQIIQQEKNALLVFIKRARK